VALRCDVNETAQAEPHLPAPSDVDTLVSPQLRCTTTRGMPTCPPIPPEPCISSRPRIPSSPKSPFITLRHPWPGTRPSQPLPTTRPPTQVQIPSPRLLTSTYPPRPVHRKQHGCRRHLLSSMQYPQHMGHNARHVPHPPNSTVRRRISPRVATAPAPGVEKGNKGRIEKSIPRACYYCCSHSSRSRMTRPTSPRGQRPEAMPPVVPSGRAPGLGPR
jgi:hypothetical protein